MLVNRCTRHTAKIKMPKEMSFDFFRSINAQAGGNCLKIVFQRHSNLLGFAVARWRNLSLLRDQNN